MSNEVHQKDGYRPSPNQGVGYGWVLWVVVILVTIIVVANSYVHIITAGRFIMQHQPLIIGLLVVLFAAFVPAWIIWNNGRVRRHKLDEMHVPHHRPKRSRK